MEFVQLWAKHAKDVVAIPDDGKNAPAHDLLRLQGGTRIYYVHQGQPHIALFTCTKAVSSVYLSPHKVIQSIGAFKHKPSTDLSGSGSVLAIEVVAPGLAYQPGPAGTGRHSSPRRRGGTGLTVSVAVGGGGRVASAEVVEPGNGYRVGDLVSIQQASGKKRARSAIIKVSDATSLSAPQRDFRACGDEIHVADLTRAGISVSNVSKLVSFRVLECRCTQCAAHTSPVQVTEVFTVQSVMDGRVYVAVTPHPGGGDHCGDPAPTIKAKLLPHQRSHLKALVRERNTVGQAIKAVDRRAVEAGVPWDVGGKPDLCSVRTAAKNSARATKGTTGQRRAVNGKFTEIDGVNLISQRLQAAKVERVGGTVLWHRQGDMGLPPDSKDPNAHMHLAHILNYNDFVDALEESRSTLGLLVLGADAKNGLVDRSDVKIVAVAAMVKVPEHRLWPGVNECHRGRPLVLTLTTTESEHFYVELYRRLFSMLKCSSDACGHTVHRRRPTDHESFLYRSATSLI